MVLTLDQSLYERGRASPNEGKERPETTRFGQRTEGIISCGGERKRVKTDYQLYVFFIHILYTL